MGLKLCPIGYSSHQGGTSNQRPSDDALSIKGKDNGSSPFKVIPAEAQVEDR